MFRTEKFLISFLQRPLMVLKWTSTKLFCCVPRGEKKTQQTNNIPHRYGAFFSHSRQDCCSVSSFHRVNNYHWWNGVLWQMPLSSLEPSSHSNLPHLPAWHRPLAAVAVRTSWWGQQWLTPLQQHAWEEAATEGRKQKYLPMPLLSPAAELLSTACTRLRVLSPESFSLVVTCQTHMLQCCGTWPQPWRSSFILWTSELFPESFKSSQASMVKVSIQCFLAGLCKPVFDIRSPLQTGMWNVGEAQEGCSWSCLLAISYQLKNECFINGFENVCIWSSH